MRAVALAVILGCAGIETAIKKAHGLPVESAEGTVIGFLGLLFLVFLVFGI